MNNDQLWQAVLGEIEIGLSRANFTTWFKNTFISSFEKDRVIICVPNAFTKTWLEKKYHDKIAKAVENIGNTKIKEIFYKVEMRKNTPENSFVNNETAQPTTNETESVPLNRFGLNTKYMFDHFIVGKGNELAHAASRAVASNPGRAYNPLFIYGGVGLGKTHLLQAIGHEISQKGGQVLYVTCEKFTNDYVAAIKSGQTNSFKEKYRNVDILLIDDIQFMAGKDGTQQEFFHTFNELHQTDKQIVLTSDRPPKSIPALEKRLLSRFEWGMIADVTVPDIETRVAILESKCREKNYSLELGMLYFIANNVQNNIRELEGALNRIVVSHEFNNSKPTIDSIKNVLSNIISNVKSKSTSNKDIINSVSVFFNINIKDIVGKSRKKELVYPRQIVMYLMRKEINASYPTIGQEVGGRDHTTAIHAYNKIEGELEKNERIKQDIDSIKQALYNNC
ncbi:MAG: chromosomal replication initiator protein DnaA [bacterium]